MNNKSGLSQLWSDTSIHFKRGTNYFLKADEDEYADELFPNYVFLCVEYLAKSMSLFLKTRTVVPRQATLAKSRKYYNALFVPYISYSNLDQSNNYDFTRL